MEEFFPEWGLLQGTENAEHYAGLAVGTSDLLDEQFDLELEDILNDYNALSGHNDKKEGERVGPPDEEVKPEVKHSPKSKPASRKRPSRKESTHLDSVRELTSLVEELSEELEILLFYQRKCYIKNLRNCNYIRVVGCPLSTEEAISIFKEKVKAPHISSPTELGFLAPPHANCGQRDLPFWKDDLHEWSPTDLKRLEICVHQGYYRQQHFFIDGKFHSIFIQMGIEPEDLQPVQHNLRRLGDDLWTVMKYENFSELRKTRYFSVLNKYLRIELDLFHYIVKTYELAKKSISPYVLKNCGSQNTVFLTLEQVIAWKQHETRQIYGSIYQRKGKIDIDQVDWLSVQKEMGLSMQKEFKWDDLKRLYKFCRSIQFEHSPMTRSELIAIKTKVKTVSGSIDWSKLSKELGTNRSSVRVFQTYKKFVSRRIYPNSLLSDYEDRLSAFLHIKKYIGHLPRIVFRLSEMFGSIDYKEFLTLWKELNPKYSFASFRPIEDTALIVGLEIFRDRLLKGESFKMLQNTLPWRHCHAWRRRTQLLFNPSSKWNFDEDRLLLYAVEKYGLDWPGLKKLFPARSVTCIQSRYTTVEQKVQYTTLSTYRAAYLRHTQKIKEKRLQTVLQILRELSSRDDSSYVTTAAEYEDPTTTSYLNATSFSNSTHYKGLEPRKMYETLSHKLTQNILLPRVSEGSRESLPYDVENVGELEIQFLNEVLTVECEASAKAPYPPQVLIYKWRTPSEDDITNYLKEFDRDILIEAAKRLSKFVETRQQKRAINSDHDLILGCNRRQFFPERPVSVASALHLRRVRLRPITKRLWETLSPFERTVCKAYQAFSVGHRTKLGAIRKTIPTALSLSFLPCVRNIIENPRQLAHEPLPHALVLSPCPPQIFLNRGTQIQEEESDQEDQQCSRVKLERVEPTTAMTEAHNSLCRKVWNTLEGRRNKTYKRQSKTRKKLFLAAASRVRWEKEREKRESAENYQSPAKIPPRLPWYVSLLKLLNNKEDGTELGFGYESVVNEDYKNRLDSSEALTVLHDHCYFSGSITRVQKVVDGIMQTPLAEDNSDSAKENMEAEQDITTGDVN